MRRHRLAQIALVLCIALILALMPLLTGCNGEEEATATPTPQPTAEPTADPLVTVVDPTVVPPTPEATQFQMIQGAVAQYLASPATNVSADDLFTLITDGDESNDPYIISLRSADHYAAGHIEGAVNMTFAEVFDAQNLMNMAGEPIVVYCYTGQTGSWTAAMLGHLGFDVQNLLHGMSSWSDDPAVYGSRFDPDTDQMDFATETEANDPTETYDYPSPDWSPMMPTADATLFAAINANSYSGNIVDASVVFDLINAGDAENDPFIISCRSAADYAAGHVTGAVNISLGSLAENLDRIPADKEVVVYCYTGQSAAQGTAVLRMLGYDAKSMKFGMCAWSSDPAINAGKCFNSETVAGYATVASE